MPRYFFHRVDESRDVDHEGVDLSDVDAARYEAVMFASDTLKEPRYSLWDGGEVHIEVTDADHNLVFVVSLKAAFVGFATP